LFIHKRVRTKPRKTKAYVNNKDFYQAIVDYYALKEHARKEGKEPPQISRYLGECVMMICEKLSKRGNFYGYCVDDQTEALTKRGWLRYDQIRLDDHILAIDPKDHVLKWSPIFDLYVNNYSGFMHKLKAKGIDALVTPGHKFLTLENGLKKVEHLGVVEHVILNGTHETGPHEELYSDDFVELVGWSVTEGQYKERIGKRVHSYSITLSQNKGPKADRIRASIDSWYSKNTDDRKGKWSMAGNYGEYRYDDTKVLTFDVRGRLAKEIQAVSPNRVMTMGFILSLSQRQREMLIKTMINGDGHTYKTKHKSGGTSYGYAQKDKNHMDVFITLLTLAGYTMRMDFRQQNTPFGLSEYYYIHISSQSKKQCKVEHVDFFGGRTNPGGSGGKEKNPNIPTQPYEGIVWCPTTQYGNFMCRRGKYCYITGNSYRDELIADGIENIIVALDKGNFDPTKYNNPFAYFTSIAWNAFIRRLNKERDQALAKANNFENMFLTGQYENESSILLQMPNNEFNDDLLRTQEKRVARKKAVVKKKKVKKKAKKKTLI
jgi:hypothetical protein